jgi:hypothetical protein
MPWLSVVIPVRNEASGIVQVLEPLQGLRGEIEIIVVDGGSEDGTVGLARPLVDQVIDSAPGRALQMNAGAALASGEVLLFLHADTRLPEGFLGMIRAVMPTFSPAIPISSPVIPAKAGIHTDPQATPSHEQESSAQPDPSMDPRVREDDVKAESEFLGWNTESTNKNAHYVSAPVIPAKEGIHADPQATPSHEQESSAQPDPSMDPRVREDDVKGESEFLGWNTESTNKNAHYVSAPVIPAKAGIHADPQITPIHEQESSAQPDPRMDPRVRGDDVEGGDGVRRQDDVEGEDGVRREGGVEGESDFSAHTNCETAQWGRFNVRLAPSSPMLNLVAWMMNQRSRLTGICTGDQAIFVRRDLFNQVGGYADIPLMEDIDLSKRLKRFSPPACIRTPLTTSSRRWQQNGVFRTILLMWWLRLQYWAGVSPARLAEKYYPARRLEK